MRAAQMKKAAHRLDRNGTSLRMEPATSIFSHRSRIPNPQKFKMENRFFSAFP